MGQFQFALGTTVQVYEGWAKQNGLPVVMEDIGSNAKLLWIGPKRTDRVVLYFHGKVVHSITFLPVTYTIAGGGFVIPMQYFAASFWNYVRLQLGRRDVDAGFAVLTYGM
jgi:hypothetical protein